MICGVIEGTNVMLTIGAGRLINICEKSLSKSVSSLVGFNDFLGLARHREKLDFDDDIRQCRWFSLPPALFLMLPISEWSSTCVVVVECDVSQSPAKTRFWRLMSVFICSMSAAAFCR